MTPRQHPADREADRYFEIESALAPRTRAASRLLLIVLGCLLLLLGVLLCVLPRRDFSPEENRALADFPTLSVSALLEGTLGEDIATFCADQFPLRTFFVTLKAGAEILLGKGENNEVLLGRDGYLIARQEYDATQYENMERNLAAIAKIEAALQERGVATSVAIVPRSVDVNRIHLPLLYDPCLADDARTALTAELAAAGLTAQDLTDPLRAAANEDESVYYKTDHHWAAEGVYIAYVELAATLGYTPFPRGDFVQTQVCDDFIGTTHASSGLYWTAGEAMELWRYEGDETFVTEIVTGGSVTRTYQGFYDMAALDTHDEYNVFLGGTNTHIRIHSPAREDAPVLVLCKDSFSQALAPLLARHYDLVLIDPRTYDFRVSGNFGELIEAAGAQQVLFLLGIDTLYDSYAMRNLLLAMQ